MIQKILRGLFSSHFVIPLDWTILFWKNKQTLPLKYLLTYLGVVVVLIVTHWQIHEIVL